MGMWEEFWGICRVQNRGLVLVIGGDCLIVCPVDPRLDGSTRNEEASTHLQPTPDLHDQIN